MAGKLHRDYQHYAIDQDGHKIAPGQKAARAYAEGYQAYRSGAEKANPHAFSEDDESDFQSWEYGWQDGTRGAPATHVGKPDAEAEEPPIEPAAMTTGGSIMQILRIEQTDEDQLTVTVGAGQDLANGMRVTIEATGNTAINGEYTIEDWDSSFGFFTIPGELESPIVERGRVVVLDDDDALATEEGSA